MRFATNFPQQTACLQKAGLEKAGFVFGSDNVWHLVDAASVLRSSIGQFAWRRVDASWLGESWLRILAVLPAAVGLRVRRAFMSCGFVWVGSGKCTEPVEQCRYKCPHSRNPHSEASPRGRTRVLRA